jgi:hypothetical protein
MLISCHQTIGENHYIKVANKFFEKVENFEYFETTITNQKCIHEEIKSRINSQNAC